MECLRRHFKRKRAGKPIPACSSQGLARPVLAQNRVSCEYEPTFPSLRHLKVPPTAKRGRTPLGVHQLTYRMTMASDLSWAATRVAGRQKDPVLSGSSVKETLLDEMEHGSWRASP